VGLAVTEGVDVELAVGLGGALETSTVFTVIASRLLTRRAAGTTIMPTSTVSTKMMAPHSRRTKAQFTSRGRLSGR